MLTDLFAVGASYLGFDGAKDRNRRRNRQRRVYSQDTYLRNEQRDHLGATALDAQRNFSLASWMIRRHLDYVATFNFQATSPNEKWNEELERFIVTWGRDCDVRGRHPLRRFVRLLEATRTMQGDVFIQKISSGKHRGRIQAIEPDLVRIPDTHRNPNELAKFRTADWINGVRVDDYGRAVAYALTQRQEGGNYIYSRLLDPEDTYHFGYFDRFDQVRGISPLASCLNAMSDFYEANEMAYLKIKLAASFGLATFRDSMDAMPGTHATVDSDGDGVADAAHEINLSQGPYNIELNVGEDARIIESKSPPAEMMQFLSMSSGLILKALDLPYAFFDESSPTFHGGHAAFKNYEKACREKRLEIQDCLTDLTDWMLPIAVADGHLRVPRGIHLEERPWEWIPSGSPYWNEEKEVKSEIAAIAAGLDNPIDAAKRHGRDYRTNIDRIAQAQEYAEAKNVTIVLAQQTTHTESVSAVVEDESVEDEAEDQNEDQTEESSEEPSEEKAR